MRFLRFNGSTTKILLPSAEEPLPAEDALEALAQGEELSGYVVSGLDLTDRRMGRVAMRNCIIEDANLSNVAADEVDLDRVVVTDSTLVGFCARTITLKGSLFDTCRLDLATLSGLKITDPSAFVGCSMREADLSDAAARDGIFYDCDLTGADLRSARLDGADLRGSRLTAALGLATVRRAVLDPDQLTDLLLDVQRELGIAVNESDAGPVLGWREVPES